MTLCLFDENLSPNVARGLSQIGFKVLPIGDDPAPSRGSKDIDNIKWCLEKDAVLFTSDRGRKDKEILEGFRKYPGVSVVLVPDGMTGQELSANFHKRIESIEEIKGRGKRVRKKITNNGGWKDLN